MKRISHTIGALCMLVVCIVSASLFAETEQSSGRIEERVNTLLRQMTLKEKAGQLTQFASGILSGPGFHRDVDEEMVRRGEVGSLLGVVGAEHTNSLQHIAMEQSRLHIPLLFGFDVIHGERTIFPIPLALASTFDPAMVERVSHLAATEARADGIQWVFSPMVDIARDARWGRIAESAGEDPFLGNAMARAYVHGYQGSDLAGPDAVAACVKHFAAYGASLAGRDYNTVDMSQTQLRQVYLPPYRSAVDIGAATVMTAFSTLNGVPPTASPTLLTDVLRHEWNFHGVVVSDWNAVGELVPHGVAATPRDAARLAINAGTDMDMESNAYLENLPSLVQTGQVPLAVVDEAVRRVLRLKFQLGLFDRPYAPSVVGIVHPSAAGRDLARRAAEESFVLLKNDLAPAPERTPDGAALPLYGAPRQPLLPLRRQPHQTIALIGPLADNRAQMIGSWPGAGDAADVVTLHDALSSRLGTSLLYAEGINSHSAPGASFEPALDVARRADVIIMALGEDEVLMTGEASSRTQLGLPGRQQALLEAVAALGKPVVLVLFSGRPLQIPWAAHHVSAILEAWLPGLEAGPAIAATLFGESVPSGRLPAEFPYSVGQEPLFLAQLSTGRPADGVDLSRFPRDGDEKSYSRYVDEYNEPVFPFGWGLSYTTFRYGAPQIQPPHASSSLVVTVPVTNTGSVAADEVAQLYVHRRVAPLVQPVRELKGFQRVHLSAGETTTLHFTVTEKDLAFFSGDHEVVGADAEFDLWTGGSSAATEHVLFQSRGGRLEPVSEKESQP